MKTVYSKEHYRRSNWSNDSSKLHYCKFTQASSPLRLLTPQFWQLLCPNRFLLLFRYAIYVTRYPTWSFVQTRHLSVGNKTQCLLPVVSTKTTKKVRLSDWFRPTVLSQRVHTQTHTFFETFLHTTAPERQFTWVTIHLSHYSIQKSFVSMI